ncbi:hypothetical protein PanWU01x14_137910 [Parasponia andersonii]|uniref:Uncharacterized protein n=1 Tax=Parasponia andersonii TaxID=3476 RepID=A0A2P5CN38_PARAD|nr:hypothetical protein PanWU01x14_137910 [Parasponia andersonii]
MFITCIIKNGKIKVGNISGCASNEELKAVEPIQLSKEKLEEQTKKVFGIEAEVEVAFNILTQKDNGEQVASIKSIVEEIKEEELEVVVVIAEDELHIMNMNQVDLGCFVDVSK